MAMSAIEIETMIHEAFPDARVEVKDLAGDGNHYAATVVSTAFKGKSRVRQHQMVYEALKGRMGGELHALASEVGGKVFACDATEPGQVAKLFADVEGTFGALDVVVYNASYRVRGPLIAAVTTGLWSSQARATSEGASPSASHRAS